MADPGMVRRYAHLSPGHLAAAVEKIVTRPAGNDLGAPALGLNLDLSRDAARAGETRLELSSREN